jgi:hypothetical protein
MHNPQPKNFTWLFLATYADAKALPVVLRTQANTEDEARSQLSGDFSLTFAAKSVPIVLSLVIGWIGIVLFCGLSWAAMLTPHFSK